MAVALFGIIFVLQFSKQGTKNGESLIEVQNYYAIQFENKVSEIKVLLEYIDNPNKMIVLKDVERMKAETERTLLMTEEENIPFVVGLYSSKMEALEHIRNILE